MPAELTEVDTLPGAQGELSVGNGDGDRGPHEGCLGMCGHVVVTFEGVLVIRLALPHETVEDVLHVYAYIRVCVLVDCQGSRGVLYEEME